MNIHDSNVLLTNKAPTNKYNGVRELCVTDKDTGVCKNILLEGRRPLGASASKTTRQGAESSLCRWIARQRLAERVALLAQTTVW